MSFSPEKPHFPGYKRTHLSEHELGLEKGRLIRGVDSHPVLLRPLEKNEYEVVFKNTTIKSAVPGVNAEDFLYMIDNDQEIGVAVMGNAPHWRNVATPGETIYTDESGRAHHFFEISTKGIGMVKSEVLDDYDFDTLARRNEYGAQINLGHSWRADYELYDGNLIELGQRLTRYGIRSELYWCIAKVHKVSFGGQIYDVDDARARGIIHKNRQLHPYLGVRVLRTNHRIEDFTDSETERQRAILADVFDAFNREMTLTDPKSVPLDYRDSEHLSRYYFHTLTEYVTNLAKLISHALVYYHMHSSNLTLRGEIVDTGVIEGIYSAKRHTGRENRDITQSYHGVRLGYLKDMRDCVMCIRKLLKGLERYGDITIDRQQAYEAMTETFTHAFEPMTLRGLDRKAETNRISEAFREIAHRMMVGRETLPSLKHHDIESWNLETLK